MGRHKRSSDTSVDDEAEENENGCKESRQYAESHRCKGASECRRQKSGNEHSTKYFSFRSRKVKGRETALKPVRLIMPSKGQNGALKSQIALRDAALKVERSKVIALEATLELLRSQIECRN